MSDFTIADLNFRITGNNYKYFSDNMNSYKVCADNFVPDFDITYFDDNNIQVPQHSESIEINRRFWLRTLDGGYAFYDNIPEMEENLSLMKCDKDFKKIEISLHNITESLGIPTDLRSFNIVGDIFKTAILQKNGLIIHASTIDYNGQAIAFCAKSGTGKSTHTSLWKQFYPETVIINDDAPVLRCFDGEFFAYGAPWSGKTNTNSNLKSKLKAIVFLKQAKENSICKANSLDALRTFLNEGQKPVFKELMDLNLDMINKLIKTVPMYVLSCDISKDAVDLVKRTVF